MRATIAIILFLLGAAGTTAFWMRHRPRGANTARPTVLVVSGDTAGWITPCGCTANQSGGLLRRGYYIANLRQGADVIYADVGGAPAGVSPYQRVKFEAVLSGERAMGICAHNLGEAELLLGAAYLRKTRELLKAPFISANTRDADGGAIAEPLIISDSGGVRVALIGVVSQRYATAEIRIEEPRTAILAALAEARGRADRVIVLAYLPEEELAQLAADLPEADAVIGGPTGQAIAPRSAGATLIAAATNKGKFLVQLDLSGASSHQRVQGKIVEVGPLIPDQAEQLANLHQYLTALGARDFTAAESGLAPALPPGAPAAYHVAGSASCQSCHAAETQSWATSHHSRAWQTLQPRGFQVDPYCLQCHTTGYGLPGGFDSLRTTPALVGVGCENCHGPSQAHVKEPKVRTSYVAANQCIRCHDDENSPHFDYPSHWARIMHGKAATVSPTPQPIGEVKS